MNYAQYPVRADSTLLHYEFESEGPNGKIRKVISYNLQNAHGKSFFNLAFGDQKTDSEKVSHSSVSNNGDRDKILKTVAYSIMEVTGHFPDIPILVIGSTPARTRLYQMAIALNLSEIEETLEIWGFKNDDWEPFEKGEKYEGFLVKKREKDVTLGDVKQVDYASR